MEKSQRHIATELRSWDEILRSLPEGRSHAAVIVNRLSWTTGLAKGTMILEIGATHVGGRSVDGYLSLT